MEPRLLNPSQSINPEVVGKILEYATTPRDVFLKEIENLNPASIEAYALILEWIAGTSGNISDQEWDIFSNSNKLWKNLEALENGQCRYNLLRIIKILAYINPINSAFYMFESDSLKADVFEMVVQGCLLKRTLQHLDCISQHALCIDIFDILSTNDDEKLRVKILRSLSTALDEFPANNILMNEIRKLIMSGDDSRIMEILIFLQKHIVLVKSEELQTRVSEVICRVCESEDSTMRKRAFYALKMSIEILKNKSNGSEEEISSSNSFIAILNAVEQNQSHLVLPAIKMLPQIEIIELKWRKILLKSILKNHNKLILSSTLEYLMSSSSFHDVLEDLLPNAFSALNQESFHREESEIAQKFCLQAFTWDWRMSLEKFSGISWLPYPLYSILTYIHTPGTVYLLDPLDPKGRDPKHKNGDSSLMFLKIMSNISSLQTDQDTKKTIFIALLNFMKLVKNFLPMKDKERILTKIMEIYQNDAEVIEHCRDAFNNNQLILKLLPRDIVETYNGDLLEIFHCANDFDVEDLMYLANTFPENGYRVNEAKAVKLLYGPKKFNKYSENERFILLLVLKSSSELYKNVDLCRDFTKHNFIGGVENVCRNKKFNFLYENLLVEQMVRMIKWFNEILEGENLKDIPSIIKARLEHGVDFCSTVNLFKMMNSLHLSDQDKGLLEDLLELSYREMMCYKGRSQFASACSAFIESFPDRNAPIDEMMIKLIKEVPLNSPEITQAIAGKLKCFNTELLVKLLSLRESVQMSLMKKNSPLRDLQFAIVKHMEALEDDSILNSLVKIYGDLSKSKAMYYPNSNHHLDKLRIIQGIAGILNLKPSWRPEFLHFLFNEANQPSILYILELIVAHTIPTESTDQLLEMLKTPKDLKMHSAQSIFCILYLLCRKNRNSEFSRKCFSTIYPWTMGQNFSCRLYAQIALLKIHQLIEDVQPQEMTIISAIEFSFNHLSGNPAKNTERLERDFRFNRLNIHSLLSPTYIFRDIPRITGVAESEIVPNCSGEEDLEDVVHPWQEKQSSGPATVQETYENIQTKILLPEESIREEKKSSGLIVCASLVENHPNLGGLARTCEILGAQRLILNSLRDTENSQFLALSMSAEKWLTFEEVKKWQLNVFCAEMKSQGYTIVGAEQTSKSVKLSDVAFPEKAVLILGHEKEGIPADLIACLDMAVEIPQIGRLRSLNVHVTGSIFAYEYAKQHLS